ncbi:MAG: acyltransferase [Eubacterium sp.]|nr:acyltransferase [Eubacterium sp.]
MNQVLLWALCVLVAGVLLFGVKVAKKGEWQEDFLSLSTSKSLLGVFAVLIVLHHLAQLMGNLQMNPGPLAYLEYVGVCFVGMFFFFSGYGLMYSKNKREDYFDGFLRKRLTSILVPFYFCIIIFVAFSLFMQMPMQPMEIVAYLSGWWLLNTQMWYVVEIAFLYLAFYVIFRLVKNETAGLWLMGIFITAMVVASILIGHGPECESDKWLQGEWWFNTTYMFLIGMIFAKHEQKLVAFAKKYYPVLLVISTLAAVGLSFPAVSRVQAGTYYCEYEPGLSLASVFGIKLLTLIFQFAMTFFTIAAILLVMMKVKCQNAVMKSLGKVALELYLIHNLYLIMFGYMGIGGITQPGILTLAVVICALVTAYVIHVPIRRLVRLISGNK